MKTYTIADFIAQNVQQIALTYDDSDGYALDLSEKGLTSLHGIDQLEQFVDVSKINSLYLHNNYLVDHVHDSNFPKSPFVRFANLLQVDLRCNQFTKLPEDMFDGLNNLAHLYLGHNRLTSLPAGIFDGMTKLVWLEITKNKLTELPPNIFHNLASLNLLELSHNQLTQLPEKIFFGINRSRRIFIDLSYNRLEILHENIFQNLSQLQCLNLGNNQLTHLPKDIFMPTPYLRTLNLLNNWLSEEQKSSITKSFVYDRRGIFLFFRGEKRIIII